MIACGCCEEVCRPCSCEIEAAREADFFLRCEWCEEFPCECDEDDEREWCIRCDDEYEFCDCDREGQA